MKLIINQDSIISTSLISAETIGSSSSLGNGNKVSLVEPGDDTMLIVLVIGNSDDPVHRFGLKVPETLDVKVGLIDVETQTVTGIEVEATEDDDIIDFV